MLWLKVSHEEFIRDGLAGSDASEELTRALEELHADGAESVLVSRADQPALALIDEELFQVGCPGWRPRDSRGAGDSITAGVAAVLARGGDSRTAIRTGAAAGALNVTRHGLGTGGRDSHPPGRPGPGAGAGGPPAADGPPRTSWPG